jgi:hypothetical protein
MTLRKALKTGKPIRLPGRTWCISNKDPYTSSFSYVSPHTWLDPEWFLSVTHLTVVDILSKNWEVKK